MKSPMRRRIFGISGAVIIAAVFATHVFAASSTNYTIPGDNTSSVGGGTSSSTNYTIPKASGDTAGGTSSSTNYGMKSGVIFIEKDCNCIGINTADTCPSSYVADTCGVAGQCQGTKTTCGGPPPPPPPPQGGTTTETTTTTTPPPVVTQPPTETTPPASTPTETPPTPTEPLPPTYGPPEVPTPPLVPAPAGSGSTPEPAPSPSTGGGGGGGGTTTPEPGGTSDGGTLEPDRLTARDIVFALQFETMRAVTEETPQGLKINVYPGHPVTVTIPNEKIKRPIDRVLLQVSEQHFQFVKVSEGYRLEFPSPPSLGLYPMSIAAMYEDNTTDLINFLIEVKPPSLIYSYGSIIPEPDAVVTLYEKTEGGWRVFDASPYKQSNPQRTNAEGHYAFVVPPGTYFVSTEKQGYFKARSNEFTTGSNVIESNIEIVKVPKSLVAVIRAVPRLLKHSTERVVSNPVVERSSEQIVTPTIAAAVVANAAVAIPAVPFLSYLQYIVTQPLWLLRRRKRKGWGVIFNSLTKLPVDLVIVRLLDAQTDRVIATRVTDREGRYSFISPEGRFKVQVQKQGFVYPTRYLKGKSEDLGFTDLYEGGVITAHKGALVAVNIAMDPVERVAIPSEVLWKYRKQKIQTAVSMSGILMAGIVCVIAPTALTFGMLGGHILLFALFRRLAYPRRPKSWGVVYDAGNKVPVGQAIVRIFETKFNKLLESWPTDAQGRYSFLVGNNVYFVTVEKPGYSKYESNQIDLRNKPSVVNFDIPLGHPKS